jgi:hypothetical protein
MAVSAASIVTAHPTRTARTIRNGLPLRLSSSAVSVGIAFLVRASNKTVSQKKPRRKGASAKDQASADQLPTHCADDAKQTRAEQDQAAGLRGDGCSAHLKRARRKPVLFGPTIAKVDRADAGNAD